MPAPRYRWEHVKLRARLAPEVAAGGVLCWRCRTPIAAGGPWDLGHDDADPTVYRGPEHRGKECAAGGNRGTRTVGRATAARAAATVQARTGRSVRAWVVDETP